MKIITVCVLILLQGCASTLTSDVPVIDVSDETEEYNAARWDLMVGRWYGKQPIENGIREQLTERFANGSYKITFKRTFADDRVEKNIELGQWGISGPIYFSIYQGWLEGDRLSVVRDGLASNYNAYKIIQLDEISFKYESYTSESIFTLIRVNEDFEL